MEKYKAKELISKYHQGTVTDRERLLVEQWFLEDLEQSSCIPDRERIDAADQRISARLLHHVGAVKQSERLSWPLWYRITAAAAVLAIAFGIWFYVSSRPDGNQTVLSYANDVQPGKNTATLTLANGNKIALSDAKSGLVIGDDLIYNDNTAVISDKEKDLLNSTETLTVTTPLGGTYQVSLPDGTKIWLNAGSSLKFSASFKQLPERKVWLSGEGYFEVVKLEQTQKTGAIRRVPFVVVTDRQQVDVLGTHFNVSSYADESYTATTLLEGSVRVAGRSAEVKILKPSQQAILTNDNRISVKAVDTENAVAWKNGLFVFNDEPLHQIMKQISRWYNVEVVYQDIDKNKKFGGSISRAGQLSKVLRQLEKTGGVRFDIQGRRVLVMK